MICSVSVADRTLVTGVPKNLFPEVDFREIVADPLEARLPIASALSTILPRSNEASSLEQTDMIQYCVVAIAFVYLAGVPRSEPKVERQDFFVNGDPGVRSFVREVVIRVGIGNTTGEPILLLHGACVPGVASFDLLAPGGSLAADLAQLGFDVYVMDVRGYGRSTRPKEMNENRSEFDDNPER
jgi:hypothetical protein